MGELAKFCFLGHCALATMMAAWFCLVGQLHVYQAADIPEPRGTAPIFSLALMAHVCQVLPNHKNNHTLVAGGLCLAHRPHAAWACTQPPPRCWSHLDQPQVGRKRFQGNLGHGTSFLWAQDAVAEQAVKNQGHSAGVSTVTYSCHSASWW